MFDNLLINGIMIFFPLFVYLFYIATNYKLTKKSKKRFQTLIIVISLLLLYRYKTDYTTMLIMFNIPLFLALINKKYILYSFLCLIFIPLYNTSIINNLLLVTNYISLYYLVDKVSKSSNYLEIFIISNSFIFFLIYPFITTITAIISFIILLVIIVVLYKMGNDIIKHNQELKELEREREVKTSLFKITHEIKNPIAVIKAYLDMYNINDSKTSLKYINIMKSEVERVLCLLEDFMLVNKSNINPDIMDINLLLEEKVKNINDVMNVKNINIKYNLNDEEIFVLGDYNRLSQVFINLIKNSIEADSNNIILDCYTNNDKVIIQIKDDGIGINEDILNRIKEPFYTTKLKGTGLGVSLSNEIIEAHHGTIKYKSEYGRGTSVKVTLPIYEI